MKKDYYKVSELSSDFEQWNAVLNVGTFDEKTRKHLLLVVWQTKAQLAIAQQLTMIAQHLGEIVGKSKEGK